VTLAAPTFTLLVSVASLLAAQAGFESAKELYFRGVDGDKDAQVKAKQELEKLYQTNGNDPLVLAYFGSARLLESRQVLAPWTKGKLAKEGLSLLDRAVELSPADLEVRFMRAASTLSLPSMFRRRNQSEADFALIAPQVEDAVRNRNLPPRLGAAVLFYQGEIHHKKGDKKLAESCWRAAVRLAPDSPPGKSAARKIIDLA
jgi:tetratricopeptide (TPR) repeat protein